MNDLLKKLLTLMVVASLTTTLSTQPVQAQECHTQYGGGEVCDDGNVSLDKVVWQDKDNQGNTVDAWKDNIDSSDYRFSPGEEVRFELRVKNTGDVKLKRITVRDILPSYLEYVSGGEYYDSSRTVEWKVYDLEAGDEVTKSFTARFVSESHLDTGVTCVTNKGEAYVRDGDSDTDTALVCVQKGTSERTKILGVTHLPETGPEMPIVTGLVSTLVGIGGLKLLRMKKEL